eukprot:7536103-Lingulodinium_polyedra.AAC.1
MHSSTTDQRVRSRAAAILTIVAQQPRGDFTATVTQVHDSSRANVSSSSCLQLLPLCSAPLLEVQRARSI